MKKRQLVHQRAVLRDALETMVDAFDECTSDYSKSLCADDLLKARLALVETS